MNAFARLNGSHVTARDALLQDFTTLGGKLTQLLLLISLITR